MSPLPLFAEPSYAGAGAIRNSGAKASRNDPTALAATIRYRSARGANPVVAESVETHDGVATQKVRTQWVEDAGDRAISEAIEHLAAFPVFAPLNKEGKKRKCFCGRYTKWRFVYGKHLSPSVCMLHMSPEERGLVIMYASRRGLSVI